MTFKIISRTIKLLIASILIMFLSLDTFAQNADDKIENSEIEEVVLTITNLLDTTYVFPELAKQMGVHITKKLADRDYDEVTNPDTLAAVLTRDLRSISQDKHIKVSFDPEFVASVRETTDEEQSEHAKKWQEESRKHNYGFKELKIMDGNIGYLKLNAFIDTSLAMNTAVSAMNFLSNTDAMVIDLRDNGGGSPTMIQLISSYLLNDSIHLNSFYWRPTDEFTETWTFPVPGKRSLEKPVIVLTSNFTFSAAEEFTYNLKNLKRSVTIGEVTGGGAHPGYTRVATNRFAINIPIGRAINPVTATNWEGVGVLPDIKVVEDSALVFGLRKAANLIEEQITE